MIQSTEPAFRGRAPAREIDTSSTSKDFVASTPASPSTPISPGSPRFYQKTSDGGLDEFFLDQKTGKSVNVSSPAGSSPVSGADKEAALQNGVKGVSKLMERKAAAQEQVRLRRESSRTVTPSGDRSGSDVSSSFSSLDLDAA